MGENLERMCGRETAVSRSFCFTLICVAVCVTIENLFFVSEIDTYDIARELLRDCMEPVFDILRFEAVRFLVQV